MYPPEKPSSPVQIITTARLIVSCVLLDEGCSVASKLCQLTVNFQLKSRNPIERNFEQSNSDNNTARTIIS